MAVYLITGKLGGGKNLVAVGRGVRDYVKRGRPVATNMDLDLVKVCGGDAELARKARVVRLPDFPTSQNLHELGEIDNDGDESLNGALVIDECGLWLNARAWSDNDRMAVLDWLLHSRKKGWDVYLIVQSLTLLDKAVRESVGELIVYCRRMDRVAVPMLGTILKWVTLGRVRLRFPRVHVATVKYGLGPTAMDFDTWIIRGNDLFGAYRTKQLYSRTYEAGPFSYIPNAHPFRPTGWVPKEAEGQPAATASAGAAGGPKRGKLPQVEALMALEPDERIRRWRELAASGAI